VPIEPARIRALNDAPPHPDGRYVLYWMQQSQRAAHNPALEHAVQLANERNEPVLVGFGLYEGYPEASERHFAFLLEGLADAAGALHARGMKLVVRRGRPDGVALELARDASLVVCDRGYLRHQRRWRRNVARDGHRRVIQVEGDAVVPADEASDHTEYAARTLRPKLERLRNAFLGDLRPLRPRRPSLSLPARGDLDPRDPEGALAALRIDRGVGRVRRFRGGTSEARRRLLRFLRGGLRGYADECRDPGAPRASELSPYLHFGQISPVEVARRVRAARTGRPRDRAAYLEELIVRRELALNFVLHERHYDSYRCLPAWARRTLAAHHRDVRPHRYPRRRLEEGRTHDRYWNAAAQEMRRTGYMHNTMRMYWGKKILEWSSTPEYAYATALHLNNKYFLDGRDPSSYANVAWLFGLHDRPWGARPVFGTVRTMTAGGLERKFDIEAYVRWVEGLPEGG
jgi:deoxyribodipyrimidine photo-lyase